MTSTVAFRDMKSFVVPLKVSSYNIIDFCQFSWNRTIILTVAKDITSRTVLATKKNFVYQAEIGD